MRVLLDKVSTNKNKNAGARDSFTVEVALTELQPARSRIGDVIETASAVFLAFFERKEAQYQPRTELDLRAEIAKQHPACPHSGGRECSHCEQIFKDVNRWF